MQRNVVGRDSELASVSSLVREATEGRGGVLALIGSAGIGKSVLLAAAGEEFATVAGIPPLQLSGAEAERDLPFAGLSALVQSLRGYFGALTPVQRTALGVALDECTGPAAGRMVLGGALLSLLSARAEDGALLVLVDDLQWVDLPSAELVLFAARRLQRDRVAVLVACRPPESCEHEDLAVLLRSIPTLELQGLSASAAGRLLPDTTARVVDTLVRRTGGNPLAILEVAALLDRDVRTGKAPMPRALPATAAADSYRMRMAGLPSAGRTAARVLALAGGGSGHLAARAMGSLGTSLRELGPLEQAGLLTLTEAGPVWRHPLVRAAAAEGTVAQTRDVHEALAQCWARVAPGAPQWAWHVAQVVDGADEDAARALAAAAAVSASRDASIDAADAWQRAAQLTESPDACAQWLALAAEAAFRGGATSRAAALYDNALEALPASQPTGTAGWLHERGRVEHALGRPLRAYDFLMRAADCGDSRRSVWAAAEAVFAAMYARRPDLAGHAAARAVQSHDPGEAAQQALALHAGGAAAALGGDQVAADRSLRAALDLLVTTSLLEDEPGLVLWAVNAELFLHDRPPPLHPVTEEAVRRMRESGELVWSPRVVRLAAVRDYRTGRWGTAYAGFEGALELSRLSGQRTQVAEALLCLAAIEAPRGERELCLSHCEEADRIVSDLDVGWLSTSGWRTRGLLHSTLGETEAAAECFRQALDADPSTAVELVESLLMGGRQEEAARVGRATIETDREAGELAIALLGSGDRDLSVLLDAVDRAETPFGAARLQYAAGSMMRRGGARQEARKHLRAALESFNALGTPIWQERAAVELRASGATLRRDPPPESLTASEQRVAALVAEGRSNKEVAAALFLSPKTVEYHLGRAYRKLGVSNRTALAVRLGTPDGD